MHRFGPQVAMVVTGGGDDDPLDPPAHQVGDEARFSGGVAAVLTSMTVSPWPRRFPHPEGKLGVKRVGQIRDDQANGPRPTAYAQVARRIISQITKLAHSGADLGLVSLVIRGRRAGLATRS